MAKSSGRGSCRRCHCAPNQLIISVYCLLENIVTGQHDELDVMQMFWYRNSHTCSQHIPSITARLLPHADTPHQQHTTRRLVHIYTQRDTCLHMQRDMHLTAFGSPRLTASRCRRATAPHTLAHQLLLAPVTHDHPSAQPALQSQRPALHTPQIAALSRSKPSVLLCKK